MHILSCRMQRISISFFGLTILIERLKTMSRDNYWQDFLAAIGSNQKAEAAKAMQYMACAVANRSSKPPVEVPEYIQDHVRRVNYIEQTHLQEHKAFLASEAAMHPFMRQSLDRSCNPTLNVSEWMRERGD